MRGEGTVIGAALGPFHASARRLLSRGLLIALGAGLAFVPAAAASGNGGPAAKLSGDYLEFRNADVYTGPCIANSEEGLAGREGVLAWKIRAGEWRGVGLGGLSVVAVVRAHATLGDPFANPLPAKAVVIVDERASAAQQAALVAFAKAEAGELLDHIAAVERAPIDFQSNVRGEHGQARLVAGSLVQLATRPLSRHDEFCHNEKVFYPPLARHLTHAMPAAVVRSSYQGGFLGVEWNEAGERSAFVGSFAL